MAAVSHDYAWLAVGDPMARHTVVAAHVGTAEVAHGFLHACAALRAGGGMVAIWGGMG